MSASKTSNLAAIPPVRYQQTKHILNFIFRQITFMFFKGLNFYIHDIML